MSLSIYHKSNGYYWYRLIYPLQWCGIGFKEWSPEVCDGLVQTKTADMPTKPEGR